VIDRQRNNMENYSMDKSTTILLSTSESGKTILHISKLGKDILVIENAEILIDLLKKI
jgi:hypothetical protein